MLSGRCGFVICELARDVTCDVEIEDCGSGCFTF